MKIRINWNKINPSFQIYKNNFLDFCVKFFFVATLILMPYDAIRIMPTVYKPICLIPACMLFLLLIPKILIKKLDKASLILLCFFILSLASTIINDFFGNFNNFLDYLISILLLVCSFVALNYMFRQIRKNLNSKEYIFFFFKIISTSYILPTIVGIIDVLTVYGLLPFEIKQIICSIFGGNQLNRVTGTSFESSWLMCHIIICFCVYLYMYKSTHNMKYVILLLLNIIIFFAALSLQGFLFIIIGSVIYFVINLRKMTKSVVYLICFVVVSSIVTILVIKEVDSNAYYIIRIKEFISIGNLFKTDLSTFVRIGYPLISILMFLKNPLFGVGGANFGVHLGDYIYNYFPWAINFYGTTNNEVYQTILNNSGNAKCFYTRIFCEFGLISGVLIIMFLITVFKNKKGDVFTKLYMVFILTFLLQFDSLCFALLIVFACFYNNISFSQKSTFEEKTHKNAYIKN